PGALTPQLQLLGRGGAEGVGGGQDDLLPRTGVAGGELADGGGLAGPVHPRDQPHGGALGTAVEPAVNDRQLQPQDLLEQRERLGARAHALLAAAVAQTLDQLQGSLDPHISGDQGFLELLPDLVVQAASEDAGDVRTQRAARPAEPQTEALEGRQRRGRGLYLYWSIRLRDGTGRSFLLCRRGRDRRVGEIA